MLEGPLSYDSTKPETARSSESVGVVRSQNRPFFSLKTDDIDGARPHNTDFHSLRHIDPLEPKYRLASYETRPATPPKYIRNELEISDIRGATTKQYYQQPARDLNLDVSDITAPSKVVREFVPRAKDYCLDVADINRHTQTASDLRPAEFNPNFPHYDWPHAQELPSVGCVFPYDRFAGRRYEEEGDFALRTDDISELNRERAYKEKRYGADRKEVYNVTTVQDIEGARASHSIRRFGDKCKSYFDKAMHDPSIRDKSYAFRSPGAISRCNPDSIGVRMSTNNKAGYGLSRSMLDEGYEAPWAKRDFSEQYPAHPEAPSVKSGYMMPGNREEIMKYRAGNPYNTGSRIIADRKVVLKRKINMNDDISTIPIAGEENLGHEIAKAHLSADMLPGPSRQTLKAYGKQNFDITTDGEIGGWFKKADNDIAKRDQMRSTWAGGPWTLRSPAGTKISPVIPKNATTHLGASTGLSTSRPCPQQQGSSSTDRLTDIMMVRDLPNY